LNLIRPVPAKEEAEMSIAREAHAEPRPPARDVPTTLLAGAPRSLGPLDQVGFWGNLGVSLLGFGGAIAILAPAGVPALGLGAAVAAAVVGTALGAAILAGTLALGAATGAPAMVLLRGLFGARASAVPTVLNIAQCIGWGAFELVVIAGGLHALAGGAIPAPVTIVAAGTASTLLAIWPLRAIRLLRRYVLTAMAAATVVLAIDLLSRPLPPLAGSWHGFWLGADAALAVAVSWVPLGADYSRHSIRTRTAFVGGFAGFGLAQLSCYLIGLLALAQVANDPDRVFDLMLSLPLGTIAFAVLVLREIDQGFANVYSTAVSIQNLRPHGNRRHLAVAVGGVVTACALAVDITSFSGFLSLIGAAFVPLSGVLLASWAAVRGRGWDTSAGAPTRPRMLLAWLVGIVVYQLVNPGTLPGWSDLWSWAGAGLRAATGSWLSASVASFVAAAALAYPMARRKESE
jgi:purine-cytosine permease-like protein